MNEYTGKIVHFLCRKDDFAIAILETENGEQIKVIGSLYAVDKGEVISVQGFWRTHAKYGQQLVIQHWERPIPKTENQVVAYLSSKYVKGCGKKRAELIVQHLGDRALDRIISEGAACLVEIKGIGIKHAEQIVESVRCSFEIQQVMMQLLPYGLTANMVTKLYKQYGRQAIDIVQKNPFQLTELDLIGFHTADEIAAKVGIGISSPYRIDAAIHHVLMETCYSSGHCYVNENELIQRVTDLLSRREPVEEQLVRRGLEELAAYDRLVWEDNMVYPKHLFHYEEKLAEKLTCLVSRHGEAMHSASIENEIRRYQAESRIILAEGQREAIREMFQHQIMILTGGPGTGKTTTVQAMIELYQKMHPKASIGLAAPTGRASRRLAEVTGLQAETIHAMIGYRPGEEPEYDDHMPLPYDLIIVDEWSMADLQLAYYLFRAISFRTKVVLIGDTDQLPSVSPGNVLSDMIAAGVPHVRLTEIFRQAQESQIVTNAHRINQGKGIIVDHRKDDFYFIEHENPQAIAKLIEQSFLRFLQKGFDISDILVLSPMKKGLIGTTELNRRLQALVNPPSPAKDEWVIGDRIYRAGDPVMRSKKNDREKGVMNGDIGIVIRVNVDNDEHKELVCRFGNRYVSYTQDELKHLQLGYAITIHKSQGGQAPVVIMPISTSHYVMLARNLVYTGITRAEKTCVMIGTKKALAIAVQNDRAVLRNTRLKDRIEKRLKAGAALERHQYG